MITPLDETVIEAHGRVWIPEAFKTRIVIRDGSRKPIGSWRARRDGSYQLYRRNQPVTVVDWLGAAHPIVASDRAMARKRCHEIIYHLIATEEYRSNLDASMTELVLWSRKYRQQTRRTPSVVGELGEFYAVKALGLARASEREAGFDAWDRDGRRIEIKCRQVWFDEDDKPLLDRKLFAGVRRDIEWDTLLLVIIDDQFRLRSIHEMDRTNIEEQWPSDIGAKRTKRFRVSASQLMSRAYQVFGPKRYQFLCTVDHTWRRKLPSGKLLAAMPHELGCVSTHLEPAQQEQAR